MSKPTRVLGPLAAATLVLAGMAPAARAADGTAVTSVGQAVVFGGDTAQARDRAIEDAQRKAVEQAVGAMVTSETVTENFELISDKILSKSKGYVRKYEVLSEGQEDGVYQVKISAVVRSGDLHEDLDGILAVLQAKNMPRVLVMIAEQNVGQGSANFWWGNRSFSTNLDVVENTLMDRWMAKGVRFVDRQAVQGKLRAGPALSSAAPSDDAIKEFAGNTGAEVVVIGKAVATDAGPIMGTQIHSCRATISVRALNLDTGAIMATATLSQAVGHVDPTTGGTMALEKVAEKAGDELLGKIMARWEREVAGPATVSLVIKNVKKSRSIAQISKTLREQVRGVQVVRRRSFRGGTAELEVEIKGSAQDLAQELEDKSFSGFSVEILEISANSVTAAVK